MVEQTEAKETLTEDEKFDQVADKVIEAHEEKAEKETQSVSSTEKKPDAEAKTEEPSTAEVDKTDKVKEVEEDVSLSVEEKIAKVAEILGNDLKAIDAYVKEKGYHNDPAWKAQRAIINRLEEEAKSPKIDEETKGKLELLDKVLSNPDFIKVQMKTEGFTDDAINNKLRELGHEVAETRDDVQLVTQKLGLDPKNMTPETKDLISDVAKIADIILQDRIQGHMKPLEEGVTAITQTAEAGKMLKEIQEVVKTEEILDFKKDIEPEIQKFLDKNPDADQPAIRAYFDKLNHGLTIERLKTGKKKGERDEKKGELRSNKPAANVPLGKIQKTGDFDKDFEAGWDTLHTK